VFDQTHCAADQFVSCTAFDNLHNILVNCAVHVQ